MIFYTKIEFFFELVLFFYINLVLLINLNPFTMKKLALLFVLFPIFSFSQVLLDNVKLECLYEEKTSDCYETLKGSKIYIENNEIVFDVIVSKERFKILDEYVVESGETFYDIDYNGVVRTVFKHDYKDGTFGVFLFGGKKSLVYK